MGFPIYRDRDDKAWERCRHEAEAFRDGLPIYERPSRHGDPETCLPRAFKPEHR